jgi:predicted lipoprotein with Yx(FWY)xxD motif
MKRCFMRIRSAIIAIVAALTTALGASAALADSGWGSSTTTTSQSSATSATSATSKGPTVKLAHTSDGTILVTGSGFTLYLFTADKRNSDRCVQVSGCATAWPPLTVAGKPTAGSGVKASMLGTIAIAGGKHQVTYDGHPLYRFTEDSSPGATGYIGQSSFGGTWYGVSASGAAVR